MEASKQTPRPAADGPGRPSVGRVVTAYLVNYDRRQERARDEPMGRLDNTAAIAVLHSAIGARLVSPAARAASMDLLARHARLVLDAPVPGAAANIAGYALGAAARSGLAGSPAHEIERAFDIGGEAEALRSLSDMGWRLQFLESVTNILDADRRARADQELAEYRLRLGRKAAQLTAEPDDIAAAARTAWVLLPGGVRAENDGAHAVPRRLIEAIIERDAGARVPTAAEPQPASPAPTLDLAWLALALDAMGDTRGAVIVDWLLANRSGSERPLLTVDESNPARYETSPWLVTALASTSSEGFPEVETMLDPKAPPLPEFSIESVSSTESVISYELEVGGIRSTRTVDSRELNLLVDQVLRRFTEGMENETGTPRQHGHLTMALIALHARSADSYTAASIEQRIDFSVERILSHQHENGGWAYARANAPTTVYNSEGKTTTEFPDREYAIDAAVPGTALCQEFQRSGDRRCLEAAAQAFRFFEESVGRVPWGERQVWLLFPGDEKTPKQGSAVNYELWAGCFLAHYAAIAEDDGQRTRAHGYALEAAAYARDYLDKNGDIAYGDYVGEKRTAYAAWDGWLLAQIARLAGDEEAAAAARRITERLGDLVLPNGAMPNVADFRSTVGSFERWLVHRHGIGPYPVRNWYQLYFILAAGATGVAGDAALRALGFVLIDLWDEAFASSGSGYNGDGRFSDVPGLRGEQAWILHGLAVVHKLGAFAFRPGLRDVRVAEERLSLATRRCWDARRRRTEASEDGADRSDDQIRILASDAAGSASLFRKSRGEEWLDEAVRSAEQLLARRSDGRWHGTGEVDEDLQLTAWAGGALLDVHSVTDDLVLLDSARTAAAWLGPLLRREWARLDYASLARCVSFLARLTDREHEWTRAVELGCGRLVKRQDPRGIWPVGPENGTIDSRGIEVLSLLMGVASTEFGSLDVDRALRRGIDGYWQLLFRPNGRRYLDRKRVVPMDSATGIAFASTSCDGAVRFSDLSLLENARAILRYVFLSDRTPDGDIRPHREAAVEDVCSARCFAELSRLLERVPDVALL